MRNNTEESKSIALQLWKKIDTRPTRARPSDRKYRISRERYEININNGKGERGGGDIGCIYTGIGHQRIADYMEMAFDTAIARQSDLRVSRGYLPKGEFT